MRGGGIFDRWNESLVGFEQWCPDTYRTYFARRAFRRAIAAAHLRRVGWRLRRAVAGRPAREGRFEGNPAWRFRDETVAVRDIRGVRTPDGRLEATLPPLQSNAVETWVRLYSTDPGALPSVTLYELDSRFYLKEETTAVLTVGVLRLRGIEGVRARVARRVPQCDIAGKHEETRIEPCPDRCRCA